MTIDREKRKQKVLEVVIKAHTKSAMPVGSKYIARILGLSSATIRSVMLELEKDGYVMQPHTSAGRIPTDRGYRRYVDNMARRARLAEESILRRAREFVLKKKFFEDIIESVSRFISRATNYTGIALSPSNRVYFDGTYHILEYPEFRQSDIAYEFLRMLEEKEEMGQFLSLSLESERTTIYIGRENMFQELKDCAVVTSPYKYRNKVSGNIGVIGPMRMRYDSVVPLVECLAEMTTEALEEIDL